MYWFEKVEAIEETEFNIEQCLKYAKKIEELLGTEWLNKQLKKPKPYSHPIGRKWRQIGVDSVLDFSILAMDLQVLDGTPGFKYLIKNIKDIRRYMPSRHEAHTAALFKRGKVNNLLVYQQINNKKPDINFILDDKNYYIECKIFEESKVHNNFREFVREVYKNIFKIMEKNDKYCAIIVEFFEPFFNTQIKKVIDELNTSIIEYKGKEIIKKQKQFLIKVYDTPIVTKNFEYDKAHLIYVKSPIDPKETVRIRNTIGKARRQLPDDGNNIICIELPHFAFSFPEHIISTVVKREFIQTYNQKIGGLLIYKRTRSKIAGKFHHFDNVYLLQNPNAINHISNKLLDYVNPPSDINLLPQRTGVPFYEYGIAQAYGKATSSTDALLGFRMPLQS